MSKEIVVVRKRKRTQPQGKGKCNIIIVESSDDEEELAATALDIIEDAAANKVLVETQFQRFVEVGALLGCPKKTNITQTTKQQPEQQIITPAIESVIPTQEPRGEIEPENPKYAVTKGIIKKLSKKIAAAKKKLKT